MTDKDYDLPSFDEAQDSADLPRGDIPLDDLGALETFLESKWRKVKANSYEAYEFNLSAYFEWLDNTGKLDDPFQIEPSEVVKFADVMEEQYSDLTIKVLLDYVSTFYNYFEKRSTDAAVYNPVTAAREDIELDAEPKDWPRISLDEMATFLGNVQNPLDRAQYILMAKTGIRVSELHNLDIQDVSIDYAPLRQVEYYNSIDRRSEIQHREDVIYIDPNITAGEVFRGEERRRGNKRKVETYLPVDGELKHALVQWLAARPATYYHPTHPLFVRQFKSQEGGYQRQSINNISARLKERAEQQGWNGRAGRNVTPHFFRHFFTSHHRLPMDDLLIDYIRGDTVGTQRRKSPGKPASGKAKKDYTHEEWLQIKEPYLNSIYKFDLPAINE